MTKGSSGISSGSSISDSELSCDKAVESLADSESWFGEKWNAMEIYKKNQSRGMQDIDTTKAAIENLYENAISGIENGRDDFEISLEQTTDRAMNVTEVLAQEDEDVGSNDVLLRLVCQKTVKYFMKNVRGLEFEMLKYVSQHNATFAGFQFGFNDFKTVTLLMAEANEDMDTRAAARYEEEHSSSFKISSLFFKDTNQILRLPPETLESANGLAVAVRDNVLHYIYVEICNLCTSHDDDDSSESGSSSVEDSSMPRAVDILNTFRNIIPKKKQRRSVLTNILKTSERSLTEDRLAACSIGFTAKSRPVELFKKLQHIPFSGKEKLDEDEENNYPGPFRAKVDSGVPLSREANLKKCRKLFKQGNMNMIHFGLQRSDFNGPDMVSRILKQKECESIRADLIEMSNCIVSHTAWKIFKHRIRQRVAAVPLSDEDSQYVSKEDLTKALIHMVERHVIKEEDFCEVYFKLTAIAVDDNNVDSTKCRGACAAKSAVWKDLCYIFNGQIDKKKLLVNCTKRYTKAIAGLGYPITYAERQSNSIRNQFYFLSYILFVICFTAFIGITKEAAPAFFFNFAIEEYVGTDEMGDKSSFWFPQNFYDTVNEEEYWTWFKGPLLETFFNSESGGPGLEETVSFSNKLIGGIMVRQLRQEKRHCLGLSDLINNNITSCQPPADTRASTNWNPVSDKQLINTTAPNTEQKRRSDSTRYPCLVSELQNTIRFKRTVRVAVLSNDKDISNLAAYVSRHIIEDRLSVYVDFIEDIIPIEALKQVSDPDGTIDVVFDIRDIRDEYALNQYTSGFKKTQFYDGTQSGWFLTPEGKKQCEACATTGVSALSSFANSKKFRSTQIDANGQKEPTGNRGVIHSYDPRYGVHTFVSQLIDGLGLSETMSSEVIQEEDPPTATDPVTEIANYTYIAEAASSTNQPLIFYGTSLSRLTVGTSAVRIPMPDYSSDCFNTQTSQYTCGYPKDSGSIIYRETLSEKNPDIVQLLESIQFTDKDLKTMIGSLNEGNNYTAAACSWLKQPETEWLWDKWVRRSLSDDLKRRETEYASDCYDDWHIEPFQLWFNVGDEKGYYSKSGNKTIQKMLQNSDGSDWMPTMTRNEYHQTKQSASEGSLENETIWKRQEPWVYRTCSELGTASGIRSYPGLVTDEFSQLSTYYACGGYGTVFTLDQTYNEIVSQVDDLINNQWIDAATRQIAVEFFVYNQNNRLVSRFQYSAELTATGGWAMSKQVHTFKFFQQEVTDFSYWTVLVLTILFMMFGINATMRNIAEVWQDRLSSLRHEALYAHGNVCPLFTYRGWSRNRIRGIGTRLISAFMATYFSSFWNVFDTFFYSLLICSWFLRYEQVRMGLSDTNISCISTFPGDFQRMSELALLQEYFDGAAVLLAYFKLIYYLKESTEQIRRLVKTIGRASTLISYLLLSFVIVMGGFTISAWTVYGPLIDEFRGVASAFRALLFMMMGEVSAFSSMSDFRPTFALAFFVMFFVLVISVLFNLLIGVITSTFETVYMERFDPNPFLAMAMHDPAAATWNATRANAMTVSVSESAIAGEFQRLITGKRNRCPRIFWEMYKKLLVGLESPDLGICLRSAVAARIIARMNGASFELQIDESDGIDQVKSYDLSSLSIRSFIDDAVGKSRAPMLEVFLVELPSKILAHNKAKEYVSMLIDHNNWRKKVEKYINFEVGNKLSEYNLRQMRKLDKLLSRR